MIAPEIEEFLKNQNDTFLKKADNVAVLRDDHNISHAKLLLSQYKYARVPVINKNKEFIGVLGLAEIVEFELANDFYYEKSQSTPISEIVNKDIETVQVYFTIEEILHQLIKEPFVPVLEGQKFAGIVARQEILKAFNALTHDLTKEYEIKKRN